MNCVILASLCFAACLQNLLWVLSERCCEIKSRELPRYRLIKLNARSNQPIISWKKVHGIDNCREFASSKRALAFNYGLDDNYEGLKGNDPLEKTKSSEKMCQALECPEIYNFTTLIEDRNYRYYSLYPSYILVESGTLACIPRAGVFMFSNNNLNYSQALQSCQEINASLAHIISEERTNGIAKYISVNAPNFVGLSNRDAEGIWKNEFDEPLECFEYRAWGDGEPSRLKGCLALMQPPGSDSSPFWKVMPCYATLPFVCEIFPSYRSSHDRN